MAYRRIFALVTGFSAYMQGVCFLWRRIIIRLFDWHTPLLYADFAYSMGFIRLYADFSGRRILLIAERQRDTFEAPDVLAVAGNIGGIMHFQLIFILPYPRDKSLSF